MLPTQAEVCFIEFRILIENSLAVLLIFRVVIQFLCSTSSISRVQLVNYLRRKMEKIMYFVNITEISDAFGHVM